MVRRNRANLDAALALLRGGRPLGLPDGGAEGGILKHGIKVWCQQYLRDARYGRLHEMIYCFGRAVDQ
jgi:hypothetical protein